MGGSDNAAGAGPEPVSTVCSTTVMSEVARLDLTLESSWDLKNREDEKTHVIANGFM